MKKTILKITMLAVIGSMAVSGQVYAHDMAEDTLEELGLWDTIDENISDMHTTIIDLRMDGEDDQFMMDVSLGTGSETALMGDADQQQAATNAGAEPVTMNTGGRDFQNTGRIASPGR